MLGVGAMKRCTSAVLGAISAGWLIVSCAGTETSDSAASAARAQGRSSSGNRFIFSIVDDGDSAIPFCIDFYADLSDAQLADLRKDPEIDPEPCDDKDVIGVCDLPKKASSTDLYPQAIFYPVTDPALVGKSLDLAKMICTNQMGKFSNTPHAR
jgi:hypothetical protein